VALVFFWMITLVDICMQKSKNKSQCVLALLNGQIPIQIVMSFCRLLTRAPAVAFDVGVAFVAVGTLAAIPGASAIHSILARDVEALACV
jgi:hypothetical protein